MCLLQDSPQCMRFSVLEQQLVAIVYFFASCAYNAHNGLFYMLGCRKCMHLGNMFFFYALPLLRLQRMLVLKVVGILLFSSSSLTTIKMNLFLFGFSFSLMGWNHDQLFETNSFLLLLTCAHGEPKIRQHTVHFYNKTLKTESNGHIQTFLFF